MLFFSKPGLIRAVMIGVIFMSVAACGFHLRGSERALILSDQYLIEHTNAPRVAEKLETSLRKMGRLSKDALSAPTIYLNKEEFTRELTAIDRSGRASAYLLRLTVSFNLAPAGEPLSSDSEPVIAEVAREQSYDATQVLGSQEEEDLLQEEMLTDMIRRIHSLLAARNRVDVTQVDSDTASPQIQLLPIQRSNQSEASAS